MQLISAFKLAQRLAEQQEIEKLAKKHTISITTVGRFTISNNFVKTKTTKLVVDLFQDTSKPADWYLVIEATAEGFNLKPIVSGRATKPTYSFFNRPLSEVFLKSVGCNKPSARFRISSETITKDGLTLYPIITKHNLVK
jgi:hypothetical protein